MTTITTLPMIKDCQDCRGKGIVRIRFVDHPHGKVRVVWCPGCRGAGSWLSKAAR